MIKASRYLTAFAALAMPLAVGAGPHDAQIKDIIETQVKSWLSKPVVIDAIRSQNGKHSGLSEDQIVTLDKKWRAETQAGSQPLINEVMGNALSAHLRSMRDSGSGLFTEIFVMDNRGLNVGQSDVTSDYWQGDEAKWKKSYGAGQGAVFIDEVEFDESTQQYQVQVSIAIADADQVIGAATIGMNVELLEQ